MKNGQAIAHISRDGTTSSHKITNLSAFYGLERVVVDAVDAGDIAAVSCIANINIGDSIAAVEQPEALPPIAIEKPTVKMIFSVNDSPFAGEEGEFCTSRNLKERLGKELDNDVALKVEPGISADEFIVSGRGELHLAILIEKMRRLLIFSSRLAG